MTVGYVFVRATRSFLFFFRFLFYSMFGVIYKRSHVLVLCTAQHTKYSFILRLLLFDLL